MCKRAADGKRHFSLKYHDLWEKSTEHGEPALVAVKR